MSESYVYKYDGSCSTINSIIYLTNIGQCHLIIESQDNQVQFSIIYPLTLTNYYQYDLLNAMIAYFNQEISTEFLIEVINYSKTSAKILFRSSFLQNFQLSQKQVDIKDNYINNDNLRKGFELITKIYEKMMLMCKKFTINHSKIVQIKYFSEFLSKEIDDSSNYFDSFLNLFRQKMNKMSNQAVLLEQNMENIII